MKSCNIRPCIVNGINVYPFVNSDDLLHNFEAKGGILVAVNAEKILHATDQTRDIINRNIGYSDGIGAVWALKSKGYKDVIKLPGCELWLKIISKFYKEKTFYFVGGKQEIIDATIFKLKSEFEGINILNYRNGYIKSTEEKDLLIKDIIEKQPDVVFVAMGSPKQELLMEEMMKSHSAIYQGLGGSFDVYTGNVKRAPQWWVCNNLEWAYRLIKQPSRIKRQIYLINFLFLLLLKKF
ncbi:UDP-N-acetyl-D-mannosaminouronate:lipid I N-acetyl-D-mannosaminouronosyltransferase [Ancylomarina subtilis]|uniref:UDP-N-acetyl-D-mannosaminouronate:lipid I N-acetyl-D-mannosaminouronosyltransferase n=1 Tax=Ancylomarina subtilis TaxID=1639035 RepID=A0A4Q7VJU7_9BACT|nr:WecB/TagA/CpsF family glycosyltransferase [Ancylomarina subtilis]RZT96486.1 UDP-N-acetyl-D-mannosaminouronate:lipid I N-acetyl-D-mannosaminouronosyltransferase [Ancylomarina subtilis]